MSNSDGFESALGGSAQPSAVSAVPLLHNHPLEPISTHQMRQRLHDLSNLLTGLLGNLELANMSAEDGEFDQLSMTNALGSARQAVMLIREVKQHADHQPAIEALN